MGRHSCCYKQKLRKGLWSPDEDEKLLNYITKHGHGCWSSVPKLAGLQRCGKSCRLRWINYLRPDLKRGAFSMEEEKLIIELHAILGNRWSQIAAQLPGRTDNEIKNLWNSSIKKKLREKGIDPNTHKPLSEVQNENCKLPTCNKISEKTSSGLDSLNFIKEENSKVSSSIMGMAAEGIPYEKFTTSNFRIPSSQDFFLDKYLISNGNTTTSNSKPDDLSGLVSFQQAGKQVNLNSGFYFNLDIAKSSAETISQYDHNTSYRPIIVPPASSSMVSSSSLSIEPSISVPTENPTIATSETQNGTGSNGSCNSIEFRSHSAFFDTSGFSWGLSADCVKQDNDVGIQALQGSQEDVKWSEYFQSTFMVNAVQNQLASQIANSGNKQEINMLTDGPDNGWL